MAGAPGFEPGITGPKPVALPLGYAPPRWRNEPHPQSATRASPCSTNGPPAKPAGLQTGIASDASALGYAPRMESRPHRILPAVAQKHDQRDHGDDADRNQRQGPNEDDQDRNECDERLRDGGDPGDVARDHRAQ